MRTISGALLLIAASICLGASVIADRMPLQSGFKPHAITYLAAMILGIWGFFLLLVGLALDRQTDSRPTPTWVWVTLLVLFLGVLGILALMVLSERGAPSVSLTWQVCCVAIGPDGRRLTWSGSPGGFAILPLC